MRRITKNDFYRWIESPDARHLGWYVRCPRCGREVGAKTRKSLFELVKDWNVGKNDYHYCPECSKDCL